MRLLRFAGRDGIYHFPGQSSGKDNFMDLVTKTSRLPGVDGGYDEDTTRRTNQSVGNVDASWWLMHTAESSMRAQRDAVGQMAGWHKSRLFMGIHADERQDKRWTWARPSNIRMSENVQTRPDQQIQVQASFQVNEPTWRGGQKLIYLNQGHTLDDGWYTDGPLYLDEGHTLNSGKYLTPPKLRVQARSGDSFTVSNRGTRRAAAILTVSALEDEWTLGSGVRLGDGHYLDGGVASVGNINIIFSANGRTDCAWTWGDTLLPGEQLIVDSETQSVRVNGRTDRTGYPAFQRGVGTGFIHVPPGDSVISITGGIGVRGCQLELDYWDEFYTS